MKKLPSVRRALRWRLVLPVVSMWLVCMLLLTLVTANNFYSRFFYIGTDYTDYYNPDNYYHNIASPDHSGYWESKAMVWLSDRRNLSFRDAYYGFDELPWYPLARDEIRYQKALMVTDAEGEPYLPNGDYLFFSYAGEELWKATPDAPETEGFAYILMEDPARYEPFTKHFFSGSISYQTPFDIYYGLRIEGWLEGARLHPVKVSWSEPKQEAYFVTGHWEKPLSWFDAKGYLTWNTLFDETANCDRELITLYAAKPCLRRNEADGALTQLLEQWATGDSGLGRYVGDMLSCTVFSKASCSAGYAVSAISCSPLREAVRALRYIYMGTFGAMLLVLLLILRNVRKKLTQPMEQLSESIDAGLTTLPADSVYPYREVRAARDYFRQANRAMADKDAEKARLDTALEFARSAEEKRKSMISGITHELKTPLSIIHSHAEGLMEGIAEDKKEQYLQVILEETERMDAMVLEMLDHSRLEAGKVRLSLETVDLTALAQSVLEAFMPQIGEKQLQLTVHFPETVVIRGDEARLEQVIRNFIGNAVKYTQEGGWMKVSVYWFGKEALFRVNNQCQSLSDEEISQVWDSFYRGDNARSGRDGHGLGLSISKNIIQLHRGSCVAARCPGGMEFRFTIPS